MKKYPFTSDMAGGTKNVPEVDLTNIHKVKELGIRSIKDFSNHPDLSAKYAAHNTYLIIFNDGECIPISCEKSQLNSFIQTI